MLRDESYLRILDLANDFDPSKPDLINKFETEKIVAYTRLKMTTDSDGRSSVGNHTILMPYDVAFQLAFLKVDPFLDVDYSREPPRTLKPIEVG